MHVLLVAFACRPGHGTEHAVGWGWAQSLAEAGHEVLLLTQPENREACTARLAERPLPTLRVEYVAVPAAARPFWDRARNVLSSHWLVYLSWAHAALRRARELHAEQPFDVVHHVTYTSLIPGSPLARLGVPFVFGPLGSGQRTPVAARPLFGRHWRGERMRTLVVAGTASRLNPLARDAMRRAGVVLATNGDTAELASTLGAARVRLMCDTGTEPALIRLDGRDDRPRRRVVWAAKLVPRKGLPLALDAFALAARRVDAELHIAGDGQQGPDLPRWVEERGLTGRVHHHGRLPWDEVQKLFADSDVMLFTSVRESFGSQLVEAAAAGLPIVAVDLHGVASIVPDDAAAKVPLGSLPETAAGLAERLVAVMTDDALHARMSAAATRFALSQTWPSRARQATEIYRELAGGVPATEEVP